MENSSPLQMAVGIQFITLYEDRLASENNNTTNKLLPTDTEEWFAVLSMKSNIYNLEGVF